MRTIVHQWEDEDSGRKFAIFEVKGKQGQYTLYERFRNSQTVLLVGTQEECMAKVEAMTTPEVESVPA